MKPYQSLLILTVIIGLTGFSRLDQNQPQQTIDLRGTWKLMAFKYGSDEKFSDVPEFVKYVKNITRSHFSWASYDEEGNIVGAGGGTYVVEGDKYIEKIDFFHPPGSSLSGTSVTFNFTLEGNKWTISGYIKSLNLDPNSGEWSSIDSTKLEEVWVRAM